ncbi:hypothetical protein [Marinobacter sp. MDS2]|uniref:hypothetical protein n=1 Tax=Marinobacter sp. MDS2 TaxID=3065961 RepID=UPI00273C8A31|nr:hypothetical protein [Marinobacter sp. MDS2]MDP4546522.1 hypothetical protein [Marinobacter sp. MDS2]
MTPKQEILAIFELAMDISELTTEAQVIAANSGATGISVTVFKDTTEVDWQMNLYEWSHDECFPAKLRFLRHRLEELKQEALAQRTKRAA